MLLERSRAGDRDATRAHRAETSPRALYRALARAILESRTRARVERTRAKNANSGNSKAIRRLTVGDESNP